MSYQFLRSAKWVSFLAFGAVCAALFISLGAWQLKRSGQTQQESNDLRTRSSLVAVPVDQLAEGASYESARNLEWRTVTATGRFDTDHQVVVDNRSWHGQPGAHVVTPLLLDAGGVVLINRGWVPSSRKIGELPIIAALPKATVTITGRVRPSQKREGLGAADTATGRLPVLKRLDIARISQQSPYPVAPFYVEATSVTNGVELIDPPRFGSATNLSYAIQWFSFCGIGVVAWTIIIRRHARRPA